MALQHSEGTGLDQVVSALSAIYDRYDADALMRWQVRPGVLEILPLIRAMGFKTALVSNVGEKSLKAALFRLGLSGYLEVVISRNEARWFKPHPKGLSWPVKDWVVTGMRFVFWETVWMISAPPKGPGSR